MKTREIPRDEWAKFLNNFSRRQEGWRMTLEVFRHDIGDQIEESDLFLAGLSADFTDRGDKIQVMLGGQPDGHLTHVINDPILIQLQQTDFGVASALHIRTADGTTNLFHLR